MFEKPCERRVLAIRHVAFEDLGSFAPLLTERNFAIEYAEAADGLGEIDPLLADLVVVLGGPIGAYEEAAYPFLAVEIRLLERRLAADRPTLGICLGAQLMARALGARVYAGPAKEIGWAAVTLTTEGQRSSLQRLAGHGEPVLHWHGDTFDLPEGAVRLAATPLCENQAFAWGDAALALQFHAEVTAQGLEHWFVGHACEIAATPEVSTAQLREATQRHAAGLGRRARAFLCGWLDGLGF
jgi:GMP synthase (glutamine-hydrolysing)